MGVVDEPEIGIKKCAFRCHLTKERAFECVESNAVKRLRTFYSSKRRVSATRYVVCLTALLSMLHMNQSMTTVNEFCVIIVEMCQPSRGFHLFNLGELFNLGAFCFVRARTLSFQDLYLCVPSLMLYYLALGFDLNKRRFQVRPPPPVWGALLNILLDSLVKSLDSSCSSRRYTYPFSSSIFFLGLFFPSRHPSLGGIQLSPCSLLQSVLTLLFCFVDSRRDALTDACVRKMDLTHI